MHPPVKAPCRFHPHPPWPVPNTNEETKLKLVAETDCTDSNWRYDMKFTPKKPSVLAFWYNIFQKYYIFELLSTVYRNSTFLWFWSACVFFFLKKFF